MKTTKKERGTAARRARDPQTDMDGQQAAMRVALAIRKLGRANIPALSVLTGITLNRLPGLIEIMIDARLVQLASGSTTHYVLHPDFAAQLERTEGGAS